ncbi:uncharacterized protein LTR77_010740 [Saxophila tyrrhenica]|uniref:RNA helicase n=1 Tax=Saxophila tyrrhenica TaxID=1690608 RepID=A0AAV9NY80_9PEZI|nr:hypothetical protein LTR77_010740 [Saxophila tyrrhenica]
MGWEQSTNEPAGDDAWTTAAAPDNNGATDNFDTTNGDEGSGGGETEAKPKADVLSTEEYTKKARDAGWAKAVAFDYAEFQRTGGEDRGKYMGEAQIYPFKEEFGEVGPEVPELEAVLFGGEFQMRKGEHTEVLNIDVTVEGPEKILPFNSFDEAGLHPVVLSNIKLAQYDQPTAIQCYTIPIINQKHDVLAVAQTGKPFLDPPSVDVYITAPPGIGSGKTAAYMIPIISNLMGKAKKLAASRPDTTSSRFDPRTMGVRAEPLVVIVVPTRELAMQIFDEARRMCYRSMLRPCVTYGGLPMGVTRDQLAGGCDVLIATPGRLCDLMDKPHILTMSRVKYTVIDEADEMLDQDWAEELEKIMGGGDTNDDADHVFIMTSATFPKGIRKLANEYLNEDFYRVRVGAKGQTAHKNIRQNIIWVDPQSKRDAVFDLLFEAEPTRTMIFCNSKGAVDELDDFLWNRGLPTTSIHADRNQLEREDAMRAFRTGKAPILIATGVSARGWDVKGCGHVINYDLPSGMYGGITEYIHRIGRTARIGNQGLATSFYNDRNEDIGEELVKVLIDCDCEVPEFLQQYAPDDGKVDFDDDTDDEDEGDAEGDGFGGGAGFGGDDTAGDGDGAPVVASGWGAAPAAADEGFTASAW